MDVKKLLLAVCTLMVAVGLAGCGFSMSDVSDIRDIIMGEQGDVQQTTPPAVNEEETPLDDGTDETLREAADQLQDEIPEEEIQPPEEEPVSLAELLTEDEEMLRENVKERFLRYVQIDTPSDPESETSPSSENQMMLARQIAEEMQGFGVTDVSVDEYGYVYASIPANIEGQPVIGLIAHLDTTPEVNGASIRTSEIENYDGSDIALDAEGNVVLSVSEFPQMNQFIGHEIIVTDGMTLLGGDGKAGVAEIMTLCEYLMLHPEIEHGLIQIAFTPDKEIGRGVDHFDLVNFGANFAYTLDGDVLSSGVQSETFNEARAQVIIQGVDVYPGNAKDQMKNAALIAAEFAAMLPPLETPAYTEGYEGFYHVGTIEGAAEQATLSIQICDYSQENFEARKTMIQTIADYLNGRYGAGTVQVEMEDQSYNMEEMMGEHQDVIDRALQALQAVGYEAVTTPNRGTTDGATLSFQGLPCPNLPTGVANKHGVYECASVDQMTDVVKLLVYLTSVEETESVE